MCQTRDGLLPISQEAIYTLNKGVGYHPCECGYAARRSFSYSSLSSPQLHHHLAIVEGTANDLSEKPRLVASLGDNITLLLEAHGPLVAQESLEECFTSMYFLTRACKFQIRSLSAVGGDKDRLHMPSDAELEELMQRSRALDDTPTGEKHDTSAMMFDAARRMVERRWGGEDIYC